MASFNLMFGNLLCSHPQLVGVLPWFAVVIFYVFIIHKKKTDIFGFSCMGEKTWKIFLELIR